MTPKEIFKELAVIAPSVRFFVVVAPTTDPVGWIGDGPSPAEEGFNEYDTEVSAQVIHNGDFVTETNYMGGSWYKPGEIDPDLGGYLPQMLEEAALELYKALPADHPALAQLSSAGAFLQNESYQRWAAQQKQRVPA